MSWIECNGHKTGRAPNIRTLVSDNLARQSIVANRRFTSRPGVAGRLSLACNPPF